MSLRDHTTQVEYEIGAAREAWSLAVVDACGAEGLEPPRDLRWRWQRGESVDDVVREMRVTPTARRVA